MNIKIFVLIYIFLCNVEDTMDMYKFPPYSLITPYLISKLSVIL